MPKKIAAVSGVGGSTTATRSPRSTPCEREQVGGLVRQLLQLAPGQLAHVRRRSARAPSRACRADACRRRPPRCCSARARARHALPGSPRSDPRFESLAKRSRGQPRRPQFAGLVTLEPPWAGRSLCDHASVQKRVITGAQATNDAELLRNDCVNLDLDKNAFGDEAGDEVGGVRGSV